MDRTLEAVYENGVLRPIVPLVLPEHQRVQVTIEEILLPPDQEVLDSDYIRSLDQMEIPDVGLDEVRRALSTIPGTLTADFIEEREERL